MSEPLTEPLIVPIDPENSREKRNYDYQAVDDFLEEFSLFGGMADAGLKYAHFMLSHFRKTAIERMMHEPWMSQFKLFADYDGVTYRITGASRLGDVWLSSDFSRAHGYEKRVDPSFSTRFANFRDKADWTLSWDDRLAIANRFYGLSAPDNAKKCNQWTSQMAKFAVPVCYLDTDAEEREYLNTLKRMKAEP